MSRVEGARRMPYWVGELRRAFAEDGWALLSGLPAVLAAAAALAVALHLWTTHEDQIAARAPRSDALRRPRACGAKRRTGRRRRARAADRSAERIC